MVIYRVKYTYMSIYTHTYIHTHVYVLAKMDSQVKYQKVNPKFWKYDQNCRQLCDSKVRTCSLKGCERKATSWCRPSM